MKFTCTLSHLAGGDWLARHTGSSVGGVEVTAPTREEATRFNPGAAPARAVGRGR
jgi:hypothetical protein